MEIENCKASNGKPFIRFKDHYSTPCEMNTGYHNLEFQTHLDDDVSPTCTVFTQEQIKALLPYLQSFAEAGTLEPAQESPLQGGHLSQLAQEMLTIIAGNPSYIAGWNICRALGTGQYGLNYSIPGTKYDEALKELINAGLVEELPDLRCRYRVTEKYRNAQSPLQGERVINIRPAESEWSQILVWEGHIEKLTQLLREWKKYGQCSCDSKSPDELVYLTEQLLGE